MKNFDMRERSKVWNNLKKGEEVIFNGMKLKPLEGDIEPGDKYLAERNTGPKLLVCREIGMDCIHPEHEPVAYSYDTWECVKVEEVGIKLELKEFQQNLGFELTRNQLGDKWDEVTLRLRQILDQVKYPIHPLDSHRYVQMCAGRPMLDRMTEDWVCVEFWSKEDDAILMSLEAFQEFINNLL